MISKIDFNDYINVVNTNSNCAVIPAQAGIQLIICRLDTRFRGYDVKKALEIDQN